MPVKEHKASDYLKTPEDAAAYLNAAIEEMGDEIRVSIRSRKSLPPAASRCVSRRN